MLQNLRVFASPAELADAAAGEFYLRARRACDEGRIFTCALSGGSTPLRLYRRMADGDFLARLPAEFWNSVHFFWGDEREVPADHADSNFRMAREALLDRIEIPRENIHRIQTELRPASAAASMYEHALVEFFGLHQGKLPRFDLILLGLGDDGHVASLFPHSEALQDQAHLVASPWVAKFSSFRITLTLPVLNNAACILFLVQGSSKSGILHRVLASAPPYNPLPAQAIRPGSGELLWFVDEAAAADLRSLGYRA